MKIKDKQFNLIFKFKDEVAMLVTVVMDQPLCKEYLDKSEAFDDDPKKAYDPALLKQFEGQTFIKPDGTVDFRGLIKTIPKYTTVNSFSVKAKGFFQSFQDYMRVSYKFMGENMIFNLVTGFNKMVEENLQDKATDKARILTTFKFSKQKDYEGYELPLNDEHY